jgi:hypothetical protein
LNDGGKKQPKLYKLRSLEKGEGFENEIKKITAQFPKEEKFRLCDQLIVHPGQLTAIYPKVMVGLPIKSNYTSVYRLVALLAKLIIT